MRKKSLSLVQQLPKIYLLYFLTGNHESWSNKFIDLEEKLKSTNVKVLRNESHLFEKNKDKS